MLLLTIVKLYFITYLNPVYAVILMSDLKIKKFWTCSITQKLFYPK